MIEDIKDSKITLHLEYRGYVQTMKFNEDKILAHDIALAVQSLVLRENKRRGYGKL